LLPPHYVLKPVDRIDAREPVTRLAANGAAGLNACKAGDLVRLQPFPRAELRADGQTYSLSGPAAAGQPALRVRWLGANPPTAPVSARVVATRMDLLRGWTAGFERYGLEDPLILLDQTLAETLAGTISVIHGDLNLENVLSGPGSLVWLIDFAQSREGHPVFDFAHLESEIIAHILAPRAGSAKSFLETWQRGDDPLTSAMEHIAGRCLFDPAHPREYHLALFLACIGALKYQNLSQLAKHCLYLAASDIGQNALRRVNS
ncbi:MAG TPA: phosphotransferase, partial [Anaerolineaceae bacterium]